MSMSVRTLSPRNASATTTVTEVTRPRLWRAAIAASATAAAVNVAIVAAADAADVSLEVGGSGESIPLLGFAQLTLIGGLLGLALAVWSRRSPAPRRRFLTIAVALTVASFASPLLVEAGAATRVLLELTHVVAAAIVIPTIARRLAR